MCYSYKPLYNTKDVFAKKWIRLPSSFTNVIGGKCNPKVKKLRLGGVSQTQAITTVERLNRESDYASANLQQKESFNFKPDDLLYLYSERQFGSLTTPKYFSRVFGTDKKYLAAYLQNHGIDLQNANDVIPLIQYCRTTVDYDLSPGN